MEHIRKVFEAVRVLFDGKEVLVVCGTDMHARVFYLECVDLLLMSGAAGGVTIRGGAACKEIALRTGGRIRITTVLPCHGMSVDEAIVDEGACTPECIAAARICTVPRGGRVVC